MAIISKFPGGGGAKPQGDLPPNHANMTMTTGAGAATVTMNDIPEEYLDIWGQTVVVFKYGSMPEGPLDGDTAVTIHTDGSQTVTELGG